MYHGSSPEKNPGGEKLTGEVGSVDPTGPTKSLYSFLRGMENHLRGLNRGVALSDLFFEKMVVLALILL